MKFGVWDKRNEEWLEKVVGYNYDKDGVTEHFYKRVEFDSMYEALCYTSGIAHLEVRAI